MSRRNEIREYLGIPEIFESLARIEKRLRRMATQDQVDALATAIETGVAGIRSDIEELKAEHPEVDLTRLEASVNSLGQLDAENPVLPPVEPTP